MRASFFSSKSVAILVSLVLTTASAALAQQPASSVDSRCSVTVPPPAAGAPGGRAGAPGARGGGGAAAGGRGGAQNPPPITAESTRLTKVRDDVYVIQNVNNVVADIGAFGGNITIYVTDDGVILVDSKNDRMHDDVVAKVRSLTDKPIEYVILTHNHQDHSGGAAKMQQIGASVIISRDDRLHMVRGNQPGLPQFAYSRDAVLFLGGKEVQLKEYCGHTRGDTVVYLPAARVVAVGDLVTTPDSIPQIVNYGDGGNWTDMGKTLDAIAALDFDFMVGGHGPVLTKQEFLQHRDKVAGIRERARVLVKEGRSQEDVAQTLLRELNWGSGPAAGNIPGMMVEFR
ncbi:MAG: MBL fold metallo-hydrolase [Acidobacteria bacterium]|nr:MBL fold metallo-hydrolase [Acidobacteriota bacterium]